jgi:polar amino acid transport system substrate-binding protein
MRPTSLRFFALLICLVVPVTSSWAGDVLNRISETDTLRVGMTGTQPPFTVRNKEGQLMGMDVDIARVLASTIGVELELVELPFAELLPALESGKVDMVLSGMTATLQRNMRVAFVGPYYISGKSMLTKSSTVAAIQEAKEMNSKSFSIATLAGSTGEEFVKRAAPDAKLVPVRDYDEGIRQLGEGKVDAFLADAPIIQLTAMRYPDKGFVQLNKPLTVEPIGIALPPNDPLLINLVDNYLRAVEAAGGLEALRKKWFESGSWLMQLP